MLTGKKGKDNLFISPLITWVVSYLLLAIYMFIVPLFLCSLSLYGDARMLGGYFMASPSRKPPFCENS